MDEWDTVLDVEQNAVQAGSSEGTAAGAAQGRFDGFYAGAMKGVEVGAELGSYQGFAARLLDPKHAGDVKPRQRRDLEQLVAVTTQILALDPRSDEFADQLTRVRGLFRKVCINVGKPQLAPKTHNVGELDF